MCCFLSGSLQQAQVQDNDLLMLSPKEQTHAQPQQQQAQQQQQQSQPQVPFAHDGSLLNPQAFLSACLSNPAGLSQLPPAIRDAVSVGDIDRLQQVFRQAHRDRQQQQMEAQLIRPGEDPMDLEVQVLPMASHSPVAFYAIAVQVPCLTFTLL